MLKSRFLFVAFLLITPAVFGQLPSKSDIQIWNETSLTIPIIKKQDNKTAKLSVILSGVLRFGENVSRPVDERVTVGLEFRVNRFLTLTPGYIYRADQPFAGRKEWEQRIKFDIGLEKQFKRFSIKDRNRVEHRFRNLRSDSTRYRNKFQISIPVLSGKKELFTPFVADEPYYEFQSKKWTRNEFSAGISKKFSHTLTAEFFYLLQNNRGSILKYVNAFGVNLKFKLVR